jgi:hypothetical protein
MKTLLECPTEIVRSILQCLPAASLRDLCLVNHDLREIAEPLLYTNVCLTWEIGRPSSFMVLIQNFQQRPQLAKYVQSLVFGSNCYSFSNPLYISVDESELANLIAIIQDINPPFRDLWIQELGNGMPDAFLILFLSLTPNITYLELTDEFGENIHLLGRMLRASLCQTVNCKLPRFQYLRQVDLDVWSDISHRGNIKNAADALPLFYLPAVQSISAFIDNPATFAWPTYAPNPSNLTSLHIRGVREVNLGRILATTQNLKTLRWEWAYIPVFRNNTNNNVIDLDKIVQDLLPVQGTLEKLHLSGDVTPELEPDFFPDLEIRGSLRLLRHFGKLYNLTIPQLFLTGFSSDDDPILEDMMPKNIRHLTITDGLAWLCRSALEERDLLRLLQHWWENLETCTPYFHSFKLDLSYSCAWCGETRRELIDFCARLGIRLEVFNLQDRRHLAEISYFEEIY